MIPHCIFRVRYWRKLADSPIIFEEFVYVRATTPDNAIKKAREYVYQQQAYSAFAPLNVTRSQAKFLIP